MTRNQILSKSAASGQTNRRRFTLDELAGLSKAQLLDAAETERRKQASEKRENDLADLATARNLDDAIRAALALFEIEKGDDATAQKGIQ